MFTTPLRGVKKRLVSVKDCSVFIQFQNIFLHTIRSNRTVALSSFNEAQCFKPEVCILTYGYNRWQLTIYSTGEAHKNSTKLNSKGPEISVFPTKSMAGVLYIGFGPGATLLSKGQCYRQNADKPRGPPWERIMGMVLFLVIGLVLSWLATIAIFSSRPQASLARGILASAGVVAGAWATTVSANMSELGEASLLFSLLRVLG
jgi:hypothetical protein